MDLVDQLLEGKSENTREAYLYDLSDFAAFIGMCDEIPALRHDGVSDTPTAREELVSKLMHQMYDGYSEGAVKRHVREYVSSLSDEPGGGRKSPSTINRRIAAIKSVVRLGREVGAIDWRLEVPRKKVDRTRVSPSPDEGEYRKMADFLHPPEGEKQLRDYVMIRLMYSCAMLRREVVELNCEDVNIEGRSVRLGRDGETVEISGELFRWLQRLTKKVGGEGPVFRSYDSIQGCDGNRLTGDGVYHIIRRISEKSGAGRANPHSLRQSAVTHCLKRTDDVVDTSRLGGELELLHSYERER